MRIPAREQEGPAEYFETLESLPEEGKAIVRGMGFTKEQLNAPQAFPILLNVLGFQIQKKMASRNFPNTWVTPPMDGAGGTQYTTDAQAAGRRWVQKTVMRTFEKTYKVGGKLGEGGYGTVFQAQRGKEKGDNVAIKKSENKDEKARATNLRELYYLMTLEHPSVVKCFDCFDIPEQGQMWAVLEFMDGGTLTQARKSHQWTPPEVAYISGEMLKAVGFIHSKEVMHRDVRLLQKLFCFCCFFVVFCFSHPCLLLFWLSDQKCQRDVHGECRGQAN